MLDRETLLDALIQGDIETNSGENDWYLAGILRNGCKGYNELTDEKLREKIIEVHGEEPEAIEAELIELAKRRGTY